MIPFPKIKKRRLRLFLKSSLVILLLAVIALFEPASFGQEQAELGKNEADSTEKLISINFKETDIREVLNILAYKGKVNIIAGEDVDAKVSVQLKDVAWEQALEVILRTYNYTYKKDGQLYRVMSLTRALEEEAKVPLETRVVPLNFADVVQLKESLIKMLSKRGNIQIDTRTNVLIVTDIPEVVDSVEESALQLDTGTPQVMIEAMMVDVKLTGDDQWGSVVSIFDLKSQTSDNELLTGMPGDLVNTFIFRTMTDSLDIAAVLDMWISQNKATILANPKVLTLDNQTANIEIVEEIPYKEIVITASGARETIKFKEAGVKLSVTPHVTSGRYISMNVKPEQSFKSGEIDGQPLIDKRKAETNLLVRDGQTIVIGGLRQVKETKVYEKVPFLGDIPFLGLLFRKKVIDRTNTELVLFITPHIIRETVMTDRELELLELLDKSAKIKIDDRTEMQRLKDLAKLVTDRFKAKEIEEREVVKRRRRRPKVKKTGRRERLTAEEKTDTLDIKSREGAFEAKDDLDYEAAKFRQALERIKKEYK